MPPISGGNMDNNHYILVAGSGESSRANIESLLEDYIYSSGGKVVFVLAYNKTPNQGHKFVAQLAKEKVKELVIFANYDATFEGMPPSTFHETDKPIKDAADFVKGKKASACILWNDEDERCLTTVNTFVEAGIPCFNLAEGLVPLSATEVSEDKPLIPEDEMVDEDEDEDEEEAEEDEDEPDLEDDIYYGVLALVKAIAKAVVAELQDAPETPSRTRRK